MRSAAAAALVSLLLASPALADVVSGTVRCTPAGGCTVERAGRTAVALAEETAARLRALAGYPVELEGRATEDGFRVDRVVSPVRTEVAGRVEREGGRLSLVVASDAGEARLAAVGRTALLEPLVGRRPLLDVWVFPAEAGGRRAFVVALEGQTTGSWTLLGNRPGLMSYPVGVVRSRRSVWISEVRDGYAFVRRGDQRGWVAYESLAVEDAPHATGMIEHLDPR